MHIPILKRRQGFSFIELVIAVTIFAVIAVSVYATFSAGIRVWLKTSPMIEENQALRTFFDTAALDLKNAITYYEKKAQVPAFGEAEIVNFEGEEQRMSFITIIRISDEKGVPREEPARVSYTYDGNKKAVMRLIATKNEGLDERNARPEEVLTGIESKDAGFEYCYKSSSSQQYYEYEWQSSWEDKNRAYIPRGVRIKAGKFRKTVFIPSGRLGELL